MKTSRSAFTLVELLTVIAMVAVLATIQISAVARANRPTKIAQCAGNLRQFAQASHILATENDGTFPENSGSSPWDISRSTLNALDQCAVSWRVLYCPGTAPLHTDADNLLLYKFNASRGIIGYATTFPRAGLTPEIQNATLMPRAIQTAPGVFVTPNPSARVLLADATISTGGVDPALRYTYNYTTIPTAVGKPWLSPHLNGKFPFGGNLAMLDGHVEWRKFPDMIPRVTTGSAITFWW